MKFPSLLCYLIPLGPNILLNTIFSNNLSLCSSIDLSDQVSHPYKTTDKNVIIYIFIFEFFESKPVEKEILHQMIASIP
jgi:hypothetical protein